MVFDYNIMMFRRSKYVTKYLNKNIYAYGRRKSDFWIIYDFSQSESCMGLWLLRPLPLDFCLSLVPIVLRVFWVRLFPIFLFYKYESMIGKKVRAPSRALSTDKQNKSHSRLRYFRLSDMSFQTENFDQNCRSGPPRKILTFCQFPDLPIDFCRIQ